jgi:hypothetical protein
MKEYKSVEVVEFKGAQHWVHIDSNGPFKKFLSNIFNDKQK